ncbi:acyl-CoA dehydrogenase/oxidase C-terminal [Immersiella caudata]|uniref:Acyl-CoA dehydrogenase/oxidase C-terminal n=1 Tax=Immersiella caudata TaxID=314043 RepID=A0AA40CB48_9PEZI|nr:acyl-CoA dehydrogenase/oxidase C-terminal [Immersiella caudata]
MPVDFHLGPSEAGTRAAAAGFAQNVLKPAREEYLKFEPHHERFQATQSTYATAVKGGLLKGQIAPAHGGSGGTLIEAAIMAEECYTVEPSAALTIFATGLGLTPLNIAGKPEHAEFLAPFLSGTNCAGWDFKGCDLACVVCRDVTEDCASDSDPRDRVMIILVTRADLDPNGPGASEVLRHISTPGHTSVSGPHVRYTNVRVPAKNVLCPPDQGAQVAFDSFDASAVLVGAMGVGLMRAAFDAALAFAKRDSRNGAVPLLERQAFADLLSGIKMQTEAARALTWKAAHVMENGPGGYDARRELALAAKVFCSDAAVKACTDAINAVGITAYDLSQPFAELLTSAMVLPIFDGGNVGI